VAELSHSELEALLADQHHGRLAVQDEGGLYVVPVGFVAVEGDIWFHSAESRKTRALRADPRCCFEVDRYDRETAEWASLICWGEAAPASSPAAWAAMKARFGHVLGRVMRQGLSEGSSGGLWRLAVTRRTARRGPGG
jgi:nitroimidazol reductase NimA-like FMN-containing flavoprotein (pyridoxamine 5'-phosphate oxidase superfamily)